MTKRTRRSAEEAREEILDETERAVREGGPEAVRLKAIATRAGVTHSGLLYHFGSRKGLLTALFHRVSRVLRGDVLSSLRSATWPASPRQQEEMFLASYDAVVDPSRAPLVAWLIACGVDPFPTPNEYGLRQIAEVLHAVRQQQQPCEPADLEDTLFAVQLANLVMFGDLLVGDATRERLGLGDDPEATERFRRWVGRLLLAHVRGES